MKRTKRILSVDSIEIKFNGMVFVFIEQKTIGVATNRHPRTQLLSVKCMHVCVVRDVESKLNTSVHAQSIPL